MRSGADWETKKRSENWGGDFGRSQNLCRKKGCWWVRAGRQQPTSRLVRQVGAQSSDCCIGCLTEVWQPLERRCRYFRFEVVSFRGSKGSRKNVLTTETMSSTLRELAVKTSVHSPIPKSLVGQKLARGTGRPWEAPNITRSLLRADCAHRACSVGCRTVSQNLERGNAAPKSFSTMASVRVPWKPERANTVERVVSGASASAQFGKEESDSG